MPHPRITPWFVLAPLALAAPALATPDLRFDVCTFNATPEGSPDHMNQTLFNDLNFTTIDGHTIAMGSDAHRPELDAFGNQLGAYYNTWTNIYNGQSTKDGNAAADTINNYVVSGFEKVGSKTRPTWVVLNELSGSLWPSNATYRQWTVDCVTRLHDVYGYEVIAYSPFATPATSWAEWPELAAKAYVGVENYLSGAEVKAANFDYNWVKGQYGASIDAYNARGVSTSRLILGEHFGNTTAGNGYGRDGVSLSDWEQTIRVRSKAIHDLNFAGFIGYAWSKNGMGASDADMLAAEDTYRSTLVVQTESPHWLLPGGGSWATRNNWIAYDHVPGGAGEVARFDKTLTATSATVTLDGDHTVGQLIFNTACPVTITPGTGGTLTLDNGSASPVLNVMAGSHVLAAPLAFAGPASLAIAPAASLDITNNSLTLTPDIPTVRQYLHDHQLFTSLPDPGHSHSLGYITLPAGSLLVARTITGDCNLDGVLDTRDYALMDQGFYHGGSTWSEGDVNYDGVVDSADYFLVDVIYLKQQGGPPSPEFLSDRLSRFGQPYVDALSAVIPEPSTLAAGGVGLVMLLCQRQRKQA